MLLGVAVAAGTGALGLGSIPGTHGLHGSARAPAVAPRAAAAPRGAATTTTGDRGPVGRGIAAVLRTDASKVSGQAAPPATPRLQPVGNGPEARIEPVGDGPEARIPELIAPGQLLQPPPRVFPRSVWPQSLPVPRTPVGPGSPPAAGQTGAPVGTQTGGSPTTTDPAGATITGPLSGGSTQSSSTRSGGTPAVGSTDTTTPTTSTTTDGGQGSGQQTTSTPTMDGGSTTGSSYGSSTG